MRTDLIPPVQVRVIASPPAAGCTWKFGPARDGCIVDLTISSLPDCCVSEVHLLDSSPEPVHIWTLAAGRVVRAGESISMTLGPDITEMILTVFGDETRAFIERANEDLAALAQAGEDWRQDR